MTDPPSTPPDEEGRVRELSALLDAVSQGHAESADALFAAMYAELHRLARNQLYRNARGATLGATTLLHEAFVDLAHRGLRFDDRNRFMAYCARAMRGLVIDYVRRRQAVRHGGEFHFTSWDARGVEKAARSDFDPGLYDALEALDKLDPALAELVDLKYFCGFDFVEIADMRGVSERTVQRHWDKARLFLRRALDEVS
jgi:RNA polymerase sigma factor (TIGR02999 family)